MLSLDSCRYVTEDLPGLAGKLKQRTEDFIVEELPQYEPAGQGDYFYLFIESTGVLTSAVAGAVARAFHVLDSDVGYAEKKDAGAVTRQHFSCYLPDANQRTQRDALEVLNAQDNIQVLWTDRGEKGLAPGMLEGNRFVVRVRDVSPTGVLGARSILDKISKTGVANYYDTQRFAHHESSVTTGRLLLLGHIPEALGQIFDEGLDGAFGQTNSRQHARSLYQQGDYTQALATLDQRELYFYLSCWQGAVFNQVLDSRIGSGNFDKLVAGDLAYDHETGAVFVVDDTPEHRKRASRFEISPTAPMWGLDMPTASGATGRVEEKALANCQVTLKQLAGATDICAPLGKRRLLRVMLRDLEVSGGVDERGTFIRLAFELQRGAFAACVLREVMKVQRGESLNN